LEPLWFQPLTPPKLALGGMLIMLVVDRYGSLAGQPWILL
jgi:hypothetical protein